MTRVSKRMRLKEAKTLVQVNYLIIIGLDSFRRFLVDTGSIFNPEYDIDISKGLPKIADYGNI
jgi:hypothetical protein